jgi:hypothetical protein
MPQSQEFGPATPEIQPATPESLKKMHLLALQVIDARGQLVPQVDPGDNPNVRSYTFPGDMVHDAGFETGAKVKINDEAEYVLDDVTVPRLLTVWIENSDEHSYHRRVLAVESQPDGSVNALLPLQEHASANRMPEQGQPGLSNPDILRVIYAILEQRKHDIFSDAECRQIINLLERESAV